MPDAHPANVLPGGWIRHPKPAKANGNPHPANVPVVVPGVPAPVLKKTPDKAPALQIDTDQVLAKELVVRNYNNHRVEGRGRKLDMNLVYILWFTRWGASWTAVIGCAVNRSLRWFVTSEEVAHIVTDNDGSNPRIETKSVVSLAVFKKVSGQTVAPTVKEESI